MTDVDATFVAEYDYKAQGETELTVSAGDKVKVSRVEGDWLYGRHAGTGKEGWVAASYGHMRQESPYLKLDERSKSQKRVERFQTITKGEADFLSGLQDLMNSVISVINVRDTPFKRTFLNDPAVAVSFNLLTDMHKACSSFHQVLTNSKSEIEICTAYTHFAPSLQIFAQYASENSKLLNAMERNRRELALLVGDISLAPAFIQPLQHYPLYQTDFQDYVWLSPPKSAHYELLCSALDAIIAQSEFVDVKLKEEADSLMLLNLQSKFTGNPVIFTPSRRLLKEADLEKVREKSTGEIETRLYCAHLFNDALIYSSRSRVTGAFKLHSMIDFKGAKFELHEIGGLANGFSLHPAEKGSKVEHFRMLTKEDAMEWFPLIINQIEVLKTKRIERRTSSMVRNAVTIPGVKIAELGARGACIYKFLLSELQFAEAAAALNICIIQPLIDASKGAVLSAAAPASGEEGDESKTNGGGEGIFDNRAANTTKYQVQVITDALQEPDILIFLRAAEGIALTSREFSKVLESLCAAANWKETIVLGNQFTSVNAVALYNQFKSYAAGQQAMVRVLKSPPFAQFYKDAEMFLSHIPGSLAEKIELPRKRIKTYLTFITELLVVTAAAHADHSNVAKAIETIEAMNGEIEELLRVKKNFESLLAIQASLVTIRAEPVVQKLVTMDRTIIKEGDLKKVCRKKNKVFRFWLFNDYVLYGGALGGDKFSFNRALELHKCSVSLHSSSSLKYAFEIFGAEKSFIVIAPTQQACDLWLEAFKTAIEAIRVAKGMDAVAEAAPLWSPDHSADNCPLCKKPFTFWNRRHHCRKCGLLMCNDHLNNKEILPHIHKTQKQKICDDCFAGKPSAGGAAAAALAAAPAPTAAAPASTTTAIAKSPAKPSTPAAEVATAVKPTSTSPASAKPPVPASVSVPVASSAPQPLRAGSPSLVGPKPTWPPQSSTPASTASGISAASEVKGKPTWPPAAGTTVSHAPVERATRRAPSPPPVPASLPPEDLDELPSALPPPVPPPLPIAAPASAPLVPAGTVAAALAASKKPATSKFSKRTSGKLTRLLTDCATRFA